jgi:hypothetical protein
MPGFGYTIKTLKEKQANGNDGQSQNGSKSS